ncbi:hypothetical protein [Kitasatospora sp. NPDC058190]|uniref:class III lanthionine synthetase LanKC N-terminal domain-containing protein n=1 Tax=Kitasatospora sp. NPDC058190 TaxID=3346371 RepID=UPI0036DE5BD4
MLIAQGCALKVAATPRVTAELTATRAPRAQSGEFLTAYPADDDQLRIIAQELREATAGVLLALPALLAATTPVPPSWDRALPLS